MRIIDAYILKRFLFNFISSFVILMLIFVFQAIWFFVGEFAGKGLDMSIMGRFLLYYSPNLVPNVLPLTVLLASLMTFGNFSENYEFVAMKSSGISLQRAMRHLIIFMLLLSIGTFFFANSVIPYAEYKSFNLRRNIAKVKPALAIAEGMFSDMGNMNIKVNRKYGEDDRLLEGVIIHRKNKQEINHTVIHAKRGRLNSSEDSDVLQLILNDGYYYEDIQKKKAKDRNKHPHAKARFDEYIMNIDLSSFYEVDLDSEDFSNHHKMLPVDKLRRNMDSIAKDNLKHQDVFASQMHGKTGFVNLNNAFQMGSFKNIEPDSIFKTQKNLLLLFQDWKKKQVIDLALNQVTNNINVLEAKKKDFFRRKKLFNLHVLSLNHKYALAFSCVVLFFVGAPLGAIIRKGGVGLDRKSVV